MQKEVYKQLKTRLMNLEVLSVVHCNLRCRYCSRYSCVADKEFYPVDDYINDIKHMKINKLPIGTLTFSGGEPLLHPDLVKMIRITRIMFSYIGINIFTNGKLLPKMSSDFWNTLQQCRVNILYTRYGKSNIDYDEIEKLMKDHGIVFYNISGVALEDVPIDKIEMFATRLNTNPTGTAQEHKEICIEDCPVMFKGNIYQCGKVAFNHVAVSKFNAPFEVTFFDRLPIKDVENVDQYLQFISNPIPFCKYCKCSPGEGHEWSNSGHDVSDFIYTP